MRSAARPLHRKATIVEINGPKQTDDKSTVSYLSNYEKQDSVNLTPGRNIRA